MKIIQNGKEVDLEVTEVSTVDVRKKAEPEVIKGKATGKASYSAPVDESSPGYKTVEEAYKDATGDIVDMPKKAAKAPKKQKAPKGSHIDPETGNIIPTLKDVEKAAKAAKKLLGDKAIDSLSHDEAVQRLLMKPSAYERSLLLKRIIDLSGKNVLGHLAEASMSAAQKAENVRETMNRELLEAFRPIVKKYGKKYGEVFLRTAFFTNGKRKASEHYLSCDDTFSIEGQDLCARLQFLVTTDIPTKNLPKEERARNRAMKKLRAAQAKERMMQTRFIRAMVEEGHSKEAAISAWKKQKAAEKAAERKAIADLTREEIARVKARAAATVKLQKAGMIR